MQDALHVIFTAIVLSVVTYALPYFAGQLSQSDKARINSNLINEICIDILYLISMNEYCRACATMRCASENEKYSTNI